MLLKVMNYSTNCRVGADDLFGPQVLGCRESFDFTLLFEQSILSLLPSILLLLVSVPRFIKLSRDKCRVITERSRPLLLSKMVSYSLNHHMMLE